MKAVQEFHLPNMCMMDQISYAEHIGNSIFFSSARRDTEGLVLVEKLVPSRRFSFKFIVCHCNPSHNNRA